MDLMPSICLRTSGSDQVDPPSLLVPRPSSPRSAMAGASAPTARTRPFSCKGSPRMRSSTPEGQSEVHRVSEQGKEAVVAILTPTNSSVKDVCRPDTADRDRHGDGGLGHCAAGQGGHCRVIHEEPAFSELFIGHLLERTIRVEADLVDQLFNSSEKRLARLLLLLANFGKEGKPEPVIAKISQETLAEMIGTTRSRVSFFMNKFRKLGFIDTTAASRSTVRC